MKSTGHPPISREKAEATLAVLHECLEEGFPLEHLGGASATARSEAARRLGISAPTMTNRLERMRVVHGMEPDPKRFSAKRAAPIFEFDELPDDGEPDAEELISLLAQRHAARKAHHDASKMRRVRLNVDGPYGLAFFGDPHVDDPGCAWGDLERDVRLCRDTPGVLAVDVGDDSNNWVGRLMRLYANQEVTSKQSLKLIEWLMTSLPWLLRIKGNHDDWNTDKGDVADYIHRLGASIGALETSGARLNLVSPNGAELNMHVRHDFPGGSQFNPAHALVRETLFGYRDHILACGHRHSAGYIPIWHNDPRRLCHGMRIGTYKDFDKYAKDKGFQDGNWARSMFAIVDPMMAHDPIRHIHPFYSLEEGCEVLSWKRSKFEAAITATL